MLLMYSRMDYNQSCCASSSPDMIIIRSGLNIDYGRYRDYNTI